MILGCFLRLCGVVHECWDACVMLLFVSECMFIQILCMQHRAIEFAAPAFIVWILELSFGEIVRLSHLSSIFGSLSPYSMRAIL